MPTLMWLYLTALLDDRPSATGVAVAEAWHAVSHERWTSMLHADWSGHSLLERACRTWFVWERGALILEDTVVPQPFATAMEGLAWVFSSQERQPGHGVSVVRLVWTDGTLRLPLGRRLWQQGGPSTYALALEWLSDARPRLRRRPASGRFDAWSPSRRLLKRRQDDRGEVVCRRKQNRRFNGQALRLHGRHPDWAEAGWRPGGLTVLVVRAGAKVRCAPSPPVDSGRGAVVVPRSCAERRGP
jgi:hypothetical protein